MKVELERYFDKLFPITRSLTGNGNRETLKILSEIVDMKICEVSSGTQCYDWTVPPEWNAREAWVKNSKGEKIIDFTVNNLHLVGYSIPFSGKLCLAELREHLHSITELPNTIPYLASYYKKGWGFCLTHNQLQSLEDDMFEIFIDSDLNSNGNLTYGEALLKGKSDKEVLLSTYICHPSMANDNLSGVLVTAFLYDQLKNRDLNYSYRFLFIPETIGSIYYLSMHGEYLKNNLIAGFVITTIGDNGAYTYKRSRQGDALCDRAAELILKQTEEKYTVEDFFPDNGSDERQYCSPGFNLPVGSLMRTRYGKYAEYHTSDDNKNFISFKAMEKSVEKYLEVIEVVENNCKYESQFPFCEPHLGKRNLYPTMTSQKSHSNTVSAMKWILNYADGQHDLIDISNKSNIDFKLLLEAINALIKKNLIKKV
jgi:aminopeptidase-like protein